MVVSTMINDCPIQFSDVMLEVTPNGSIAEISRTVLSETGACIGRRPEGLKPLERSNTGCTLGDYFAEIAQLEEAAVEAFRVTVLELEQLGAPKHESNCE